MIKRKIGTGELEAPAIELGCMGLSFAMRFRASTCKVAAALKAGSGASFAHPISQTDPEVSP